MKMYMKLTAVALVAGLMAGCAGPNQRNNETYLLCTLAGGLVGGGLAAATADTSGAAVGGAVIGAALSLLVCPTEAEETPAPVEAVEVIEVIPVVVPEPLDSDYDGVTDDKDLCPNTARGTVVDEVGCPLKGEKILSLTGVNFAFDKAVLTNNAQTVLEEAVTLLKNSDSVIEVRVEGHTDSVGTETYNKKLSQERAEAVVAYLVSRGVKERGLKAVGMGETSPVADNSTAAGRAENRRVDFVVQ